MFAYICYYTSYFAYYLFWMTCFFFIVADTDEKKYYSMREVIQ